MNCATPHTDIVRPAGAYGSAGMAHAARSRRTAGSGSRDYPRTDRYEHRSARARRAVLPAAVLDHLQADQPKERTKMEVGPKSGMPIICFHLIIIDVLTVTNPIENQLLLRNETPQFLLIKINIVEGN